MSFSQILKRSPLLLALWSCSVSAPAQTDVSTGQLAPADQSALDAARALERNQKLWDKRIDWNETEASLESLVARVSTSLGEGAPHIEVRSLTATKLTFTLAKAPLGPTLVCLARLANCQVWVFSKGLVIAPETALSDEERAAVKRKVGGDWSKNSGAMGWTSSSNWSGRDELNRTYLRIIGADLKAHLAAKGQTAPIQSPTPTTSQSMGRGLGETLGAPFELPFGELSSATQQIFRDSWDANVQRFSNKNHPAPPLSPELVVGFDDTDEHQLRLLVRGTTLPPYRTQWSVKR